MVRTRRTASRAVARAVILGMLCQGLIMMAVAMARAESSTPQVEDFFEYRLVYGLKDGTGWYSDWSETTTATGRYDITDTSANVTVHARYSWAYSDSDYDEDSGVVDRTVAFNQSTRYYSQVGTDLDDYDAKNGLNLKVWFWVPVAGLQQGQTVEILDDTYEVTNTQAMIWSNGLPKLAVELTAEGYYTRQYDGKSWTNAHYTDKYYVDCDSGYVFAERYVEYNVGYFHGYNTKWTWFVDHDVTASSFDISIDNLALAGYIIGIIAAIALPALGIFAIYYYMRWRPRLESSKAYGILKIYRVRKTQDFPVHLANQASAMFSNFLEDFSTKTLHAGGRVTVAVAADKNAMVGVAYYNKEERVGAIHCTDTEVTESLRRYIRCKDFFSEVRHDIPQDALQSMRQTQSPALSPQAYNVFETYQVLKLDPVQPVEYDTSLITYMQPKDLGEIARVARKVYGASGKKNLRAMLASGDIGFVARVRGRVTGFAFATFTNCQGRNHTLSVLPEYRNQGIGKELLRARINTLANMGATSVITEIADWNLPSLHVSNTFGFKKVGAMYVETARSKRIKKTIVRW